MKTNFFNTYLDNYLDRNLSLTSDEHAKIKYVVQLIVGDLSKLLLMFVIFGFAGFWLEFLYAAIALSFFRVFTGGLHFKTYMGCFFFSILFFVAIIYLNHFVPLVNQSVINLALLNTTIMILLSPMQSVTRPLPTKRKTILFKLIACMFILIHSIGFIASNQHPYFNISIWVILLQSIQLLIAKGKLYYEKKSII